MQGDIDPTHHGDPNTLPIPESGGLIHKFPRSVDFLNGEALQEPTEVLQQANHGFGRMLPKGNLAKSVLPRIGCNSHQRSVHVLDQPAGMTVPQFGRKRITEKQWFDPRNFQQLLLERLIAGVDSA